MNLPITIGKNSNNEVLQVDLADLPHLFLSYSEPYQLRQFFMDLVNNIVISDKMKTVQFAVSVSKELFTVLSSNLTEQQLAYLFIRSAEAEQMDSNKYVFMQSLVKELKRRQKKRLHPDKPPSFTPIIVLIEDIFDLIITRKKQSGLHFLQLIISGNEVGIHFVAGSIRVYRNLLTQLLDINPKMKMLLQKSMKSPELSFPQSLGSELIITPEDLYFFKKAQETDYARYFWIREGVRMK